jgi:trimethylamine--corrinoid protein Co-methyltransferase
MTINFFEDRDLEIIHQATLKILENPGMKIRVPEFLKVLEGKGAKINKSSQTVQFPPKLVEETIELTKQQIQKGNKQKVLDGVVSSIKGEDEIHVKLGGSCIGYLDWRKQVVREPGEVELTNLVQLGEVLPEVKTVGSPVMYFREKDGRRVDSRLQTIKTAALIAKNTSKPGPNEVWNIKELQFLIEIGKVVKGGWEEYKKNPCFILSKETISPLTLDNNAGEILLAIAKKGLPCTIIPMPLTGISSPITPASNIAVANAEILGTMTAIKAACPEAPPVAAGVISGIMDMSTANASFAAPETVLQDIGLSELHERKYGFNLGIGTGYTDGKYPGIQTSLEKAFKFLVSSLTGRVEYAVGMLEGGKVFSPEQVLIDIEMVKLLHQFLKGIDVTKETLAVDVIRSVGIGGNFLSEKHTVDNFRKVMWFPQFLDRTLSGGLKSDQKADILEKVHEKWNNFITNYKPYQIEKEKAREIDNILCLSEKVLLT